MTELIPDPLRDLLSTSAALQGFYGGAKASGHLFFSHLVRVLRLQGFINHECSMPRVAAEGGEGLGLGDLVPAALTMGFVVGVDAAVLSVADAAELAGPGVTKIAVLHCLEP